MNDQIRALMVSNPVLKDVRLSVVNDAIVKVCNEAVKQTLLEFTEWFCTTNTGELHDYARMGKRDRELIVESFFHHKEIAAKRPKAGDKQAL